MTSSELSPELVGVIDEKLSSEVLQSIITRIFNANYNREAIALHSDRGVQNHFTKSYQSRFFLELLQNSRDAISLGKIKEGKIKAWVTDDVFYFANNGAEFNEDGIKSICYPAISTKSDRGMIGHKGIGFNAILEITSHPSIITKYGTMYFSNEEAAAIIDDTAKPANLLPLFQLPLFDETSLADLYPTLAAEGFTTLFKFPLGKKIAENAVLKQAKEITAQDIIFLANITELSIGDDLKRIAEKEPVIKLQDGSHGRYFKEYNHPFKLSKETIDTFPEDEAEQFKTDFSVECKFLLEVNEKGTFLPASSSKLYLYYALEPVTGLSFGIHSFFSVTIERKSLTKISPLNDHLFKEAARYYGNEFLSLIKSDQPDSVLDILAYERKDNAGLESFYTLLKTNLAGKAFINHPHAGQYLRADEVLLVSKEEFNLFNGKLGEKYLFQAPNKALESWLVKEGNVGTLNNNYILNHIEPKCEENSANPSFFQTLYNLNKIWKIDFGDKKILLTENGTLKAGNETEVYYLSKAEYSTPEILERSLAFLKGGLKVDDFNDQQRKQLGLTEYSEERLLSAALRLYRREVKFESADQELIGLEIIRFLKRLNPNSKGRIKDDISFPVIHKATGISVWKNLMQTPVYYSNFEFGTAYADDFYYINLDLLNTDNDHEGWFMFLDETGVWNIPGAFIETGRKEIPGGGNFIDNDREFHRPTAEISHLFGQSIIDNWLKYRDFILGQDPPNKAMKISGGYKDDVTRLRHSGLANYLKTSSWLPATVKGQPELKMPSEILALSSEEFNRTHNQVIFEFMDVIKCDHFSHPLFLSDFEICHLSILSLNNYKNILQLVNTRHAALDIPLKEKGNFEKFFNRILSYLHDYFQSKPKENTDFLTFKEVLFLSKSINDQTIHWTLGKDTIHIDNKPFLDRMLSNGITRHISAPNAFTKRDRGEWGKYALRIGRQLTKIIITTIVSEGRITGLSSIVDCLEVIIAFVEDDQNQNFTAEVIESLKDGNVKIHSPLDVQANVDGMIMTLPHDFYIEGDGESTVLHLDEKLLEGDYKHLSASLAAFFEQYTRNEMKRLDLMIEDSLYFHSRFEKYAYAVKRNIDQERLDEIADVLKMGTIIIAPEPVSSTPIGKIVNSAPAVTTTVTKIKTEKEVVEVTITNGHEAFLADLTEAVGQPVSAFEGISITPVFGHVNPPRGFEHSNGGYLPKEYSENSLKDIGFYGEFFIYNKFVNKDDQLLSQFGLNDSNSFELEWYNKHRINNKDLPDRSMGMGCDMEIANYGIFIEVKTMKSQSDVFHITEKEFGRMKTAGEKYFLVFVRNIYNPQIIDAQVMCNPYEHFLNGQLSFIEAKIGFKFKI